MKPLIVNLINIKNFHVEYIFIHVIESVICASFHCVEPSINYSLIQSLQLPALSIITAPRYRSQGCNIWTFFPYLIA